MVFASVEFVIYLIIVLCLYYLLKDKHQWKILMISSLLFFAYFSFSSMIIALTITFINYLLGLSIEKYKEKDKLIYNLGVVFNVGVLIFYKYINFLIENVFGLIQLFNHNLKNIPYLDVLLPVGVSFYIFLCIGYLTDVYRTSIKAERHLGHFINFSLFFPKIISGPVERSKNLLPQLKEKHRWNESLFHDGIIQIFWGLFKKFVVADRLAIIINSVYGNLYEFSGIPLIYAFILQVFYLYCDFSGYTDIALGIGKLFGINLINNFQRPLFAKNISEFWRKWHISLSNWCNDYIFKKILLKRYKWKKWANVYAVFITFLVIGIWHGDRWNYVILGLLQGIAISYEVFTKKFRRKLFERMNKKLYVFFSRILTFLFFSITLVFFNSVEIKDAIYFLSHLFSSENMKLVGYNFGLDYSEIIISFSGLLIIMAVDYLNEQKIMVREILSGKLKWMRWSVYIALFLIVMVLGKFGFSDFIYGEF